MNIFNSGHVMNDESLYLAWISKSKKDMGIKKIGFYEATDLFSNYENDLHEKFLFLELHAKIYQAREALNRGVFINSKNPT